MKPLETAAKPIGAVLYPLLTNLMNWRSDDHSFTYENGEICVDPPYDETSEEEWTEFATWAISIILLSGPMLVAGSSLASATLFGEPRAIEAVVFFVSAALWAIGSLGLNGVRMTTYVGEAND